MRITTVLFDLDGTLLPMDQEVFIQAYFGGLVKKLAPYGFDKEELIAAVWEGTKEMVKNDGSRRNEAVFWESFHRRFGAKTEIAVSLLDEYYQEEFPKVQSACGYNPAAKETVRAIKEKGRRVVLATNPIFPPVATYTRIGWTGMTPDDFELITTYENSTSCKPNPAYYREILSKIGCQPSECLMVGNDVSEDMVAETLGMNVFLLVDDLINKENKDISVYPHGSFEQLTAYLNTLE